MSVETLDEIMSPAEAAREAGVTLTYVYMVIMDGRLSASKRDGHRWEIQRTEFDRWRQKRGRRVKNF